MLQRTGHMVCSALQTMRPVHAAARRKVGYLPPSPPVPWLAQSPAVELSPGDLETSVGRGAAEGTGRWFKG